MYDRWTSQPPPRFTLQLKKLKVKSDTTSCVPLILTLGNSVHCLIAKNVSVTIFSRQSGQHLGLTIFRFNVINIIRPNIC